MSMLAGPRRKQKVINLRAKNSAWSNDETKFGQRMLEKMGWSSGKGLGANENGIVEHVVARYKNDDKGLGYEDKNDQWTKHEDDFNSLLANLSNGDSKEEKLHSGISLEDKSKKSKARVHYHKFTRGKDLTRYSEKDLANIFGKKSLRDKSKTEEILKESSEIVEVKQDTVFTEKGSMEDYFKNKLAALKTKNQNIIYNPVEQDAYDADYCFQGFSGTTMNETGLNGQEALQELSPYKSDQKTYFIEDEPEASETKKCKKKKKRKEYSGDQTTIEVQTIENDTVFTEESVEMEKQKKSKKNKKETTDLTLEVKPKNKKAKMFQCAEIIEEVCSTETNNYVPKKKKKKNKDNDA